MKIIKHGIVNRNTGTLFRYHAWGSVCKDENGVLYVVDSGMRMHHICPWGKTCMYISRDNGETWTPPIVINDTYLDDRDAGIVYMGNGRMLVTWFCHPKESYMHNYYDNIKGRNDRRELMPTMGMLATYTHLSEEEGRGGSFYIISEDYGVTWTEPKRIPITAPHGPNVCKDGTLIYLGTKFIDELPEEGQIFAMRSTDGGYTWEYLTKLCTPEGYNPKCFCEPYVMELSDGRLLGAIRYSDYSLKPTHKDVFITFSSDGGKTWSEMKPLGVDGAPPHLMQHSSGAVICAFGRRLVPFGERAVISYDNGETWSEQLSIFPETGDPDLGYPCSVELPDGKILTVYYQRYEDDCKPSLLYTIWEL